MTAYKLTAIVSGGQVGADRGAIQAAIELGLGWGGWAPAGWRSDDGEIPLIYRERMKCTTSSEYGMRTRLNVQDSDGTLLVSFDPELTGGSKYTEETAERMRKPYLHLVLPDRGKTRVPDEVRAGVIEWIATARISILNVAGPRERKQPGIEQAVRDLLVWIFEPDDAGDVAPVEHTIGCDHVGCAGFNCMGCQRDLCWGCEMPLPEGHEIKTAVRWCKADACRAAQDEALAALAAKVHALPQPTAFEVNQDPVVLGALALAGRIVEAGPQIGDVVRVLPDGTPVRWGGGTAVEASSTDPDAFTPVEGEPYEPTGGRTSCWACNGTGCDRCIPSEFGPETSEETP